MDYEFPDLWRTDTSVGGPAPWHLARLGVEAGAYLAQHTSRDGEPGEEGWVRVPGTRRLLPMVPLTAPGPGLLPASAVGSRLLSGHPGPIRQLIEKAVRDRRDLTVPDGVALALTDDAFPDEGYWGHIGAGWLGVLTGTTAERMRRLPGTPQGHELHHLEEAMEWLVEDAGQGNTDAARVQDAFLAPAQAVDREAIYLLAHAKNGPLQSVYPPAGSPVRVRLARLLYLHGLAGQYSDTAVLDLVDHLNRHSKSREKCAMREG